MAIKKNTQTEGDMVQADPSGPKVKPTPEQQLVLGYGKLDVDAKFNRIKWTALGFTLGAVLVGVVMSWA